MVSKVLGMGNMWGDGQLCAEKRTTPNCREFITLYSKR